MFYGEPLTCGPSEDLHNALADAHVKAWIEQIRELIKPGVAIKIAWGKTELYLQVNPYGSPNTDEFYLCSPNTKAIEINNEPLVNAGDGYFTIKRAVIARDGIPSTILVDNKKVVCDTATYWDHKNSEQEQIDNLLAVNDLVRVALKHPYFAY